MPIFCHSAQSFFQSDNPDYDEWVNPIGSSKGSPNIVFSHDYSMWEWWSDGPITNSNFWSGPPGQESFYNISKDLKERILGATSKVPRWGFINIDWLNSFVYASIDDDLSCQTWKTLVLGMDYNSSEMPRDIVDSKDGCWYVSYHFATKKYVETM